MTEWTSRRAALFTLDLEHDLVRSSPGIGDLAQMSSGDVHRIGPFVLPFELQALMRCHLHDHFGSARGSRSRGSSDSNTRQVSWKTSFASSTEHPYLIGIE